MDEWKDKFANQTDVIFTNMPESHKHLNNAPAKIIDREFRGWEKWFYKVEGHIEWFQQGCFKNL